MPVRLLIHHLNVRMCDGIRKVTTVAIERLSARPVVTEHWANALTVITLIKYCSDAPDTSSLSRHARFMGHMRRFHG